jgi:hypothetical protein
MYVIQIFILFTSKTAFIYYNIKRSKWVQNIISNRPCVQDMNILDFIVEVIQVLFEETST